MTPIDWLLSDDTGTSSKTICAVMTGSKLGARFGAGVPHDPGDFGRCYRLLALFPEWRARLPEMAERYPEWTGLVREWDALTALYLAAMASKSGNAPGLYQRMQGLIDEGRLAAGWTRTAPGCWRGPAHQTEIHFSGGALTFGS